MPPSAVWTRRPKRRASTGPAPNTAAISTRRSFQPTSRLRPTRAAQITASRRMSVAAVDARDEAPAYGRSGVPLWITGVTLALLSLGFRPRRYAGTLSRRSRPRGRRRSDARAAQVDRGRLARTPSEIPTRGWKEILLRVYKSLSRDRVILVAAGITFYSILALFPAIAA